MATGIRPALAAQVDTVVLTDCVPVSPPAAKETFVGADLERPDGLPELLKGVDLVIHLAGISGDAPLATLIPVNVLMLDGLLHAARAAEVGHVVVASTMHVLGAYARRQRIGLDSIPRPDCDYAISKVMAELVARSHAERGGPRVTVVRIGCFAENAARSEPAGWIGAHDLTRLFLHMPAHRRRAFEVAHAVAPHPGDDCGQRAMRRRYGFRFDQRGPSYRSELRRLTNWYRDDPVARALRGGEFASRGGIRLARQRAGG